jgi:lipopolysaccharide transport system ATP-binding protein
MSSNELAIQVESLSKCYSIYNQPQDRLKQSIIPRLQRLVGQPPKVYYREFWALRDVSFDVHKGKPSVSLGVTAQGNPPYCNSFAALLLPPAAR